jgi:hypothetical protein
VRVLSGDRLSLFEQDRALPSPEQAVIESFHFSTSFVFLFALVSSAVVWFQNKKPDLNRQVKFTYGGSIEHPAHEKIVSAMVLANENKWSRFPVSDERKALVCTRKSS